MTTYFSYVGAIDDPGFFWDDPNAQPKVGILPRRLVPAKKWDSLSVSIFYVIRLIEEGRHEGKQLDWGAWGLKMTGRELTEFLHHDETHAAAIAALDPDRCYVLVAAEGA